MNKALLFLLLFSPSMVLADGLPQLDGDKLASLDADPEITSKIQADHMSKVLIGSALPGSGQLITPALLNQAISDMIDSGEAETAIIKDLGTGDDKLRAMLMEVLAAFNVSQPDAAGLVNSWAMGAAKDSLHAILVNSVKRSDVMERMDHYLMTADLEWIRTTSALSTLLAGKDKEVRAALAVAISNATGTPIAAVGAQVAKAQAGNIQQKWELSSDMGKVIANRGAIARVMTATELNGSSFYEKVWSRVAHLIAENPAMATEYAHRTCILTPLYDAMCSILINALQGGTETAHNIGQEIFKMENVPGRLSWIASQCIGTEAQQRFNQDDAKGKAAQIEHLTSHIAEIMKTDPGWSDLMFWFATRVGEAVVATTRAALPETLKEDDGIAVSLIKAQSPFGSNFDNKLLKAGAYKYYDGGGAELRQRVFAGTVEQAALRQYIASFAKLLATDDDAWDYMFKATEKGDFHIVADIIGSSIDKSVDVAEAWMGTMQKNDPSLRDSYIKWLVLNHEAANEKKGKLWLDSVAIAMQSSNIVGNSEVAKAKATFIKYLHTGEGWKMVRQRLEIESFGFPSVIRKLMVERAVTNPQEFWPIFRQLVNAGGGVSSVVKDNVTDFVKASALPTLIVDEAAAQNPYAADAAAVLWDKVLNKDGGLTKEMMRLLTEGMTLNYAYGIANLALVNVVESDPGWDLIRPYAANFFQKSETDPDLKPQTTQLIATTSGKAVVLVSRLLADTKINEMWRSRCLVLVKYMGKAAPAAGVIRKDAAMSEEWRDEMGLKAASDGFFVAALVESLNMRRVGDMNFATTVTGIRTDLARMVFCDRVLFEQLINDKNADFRKMLLDKVASLFGMYVREQWN